MGRRIMFLTEELSSVSSIQSTLLKLDYEVMVAKNLVTNQKDDLYFLVQNFDLIIYQQSLFSSNTTEFFNNLILLDKPAIVLTFEKQALPKCEEFEKKYFQVVNYPLSISQLINQIEQFFSDDQILDENAMYPEKNPTGRASTTRVNRDAHPFEQVKPEGEHTYSLSDHMLKVDQVTIPLSYREYQVLDCLINSEDKFFSYEEVYKAVWGEKDDKKRQSYLSLLIQKIKTKVIKETNIQSPFILNKRGAGYFLNSRFVEEKSDKMPVS